MAVKTVLFADERFGSKGGYERRVITEAALASSIVHPNVVAAYHYDIKRVKTVQARRGAMQIEDSTTPTDWKLYLVQVSEGGSYTSSR